jgi:hypothetical protein
MFEIAFLDRMVEVGDWKMYLETYGSLFVEQHRPPWLKNVVLKA